jgi:hypothetical protein
VYEHAFVTAEGAPRARFRRAIERRSLLNAELAAREMGQVTLEEAYSSSPSTASKTIGGRKGRWCAGSAGCSSHPMPFALAARSVELVAGLRGPEAEQAAGALDALVRTGE